MSLLWLFCATKADVKSAFHKLIQLLKITCSDANNYSAFFQVWNVHSVLNVLHSFVEKSNIDQQLEVFNATGG
jgi:hypothetical protein